MRHFDQVAFFLRKGKVVHRQVNAFAAAAPDHNDSSVTVLGHAVELSLGVVALRSLVGGKTSLPGQAGDFLFIGCARAGGVEVPQYGVDGEARIFHCLPKVGRGGGVHTTRACTAIHEVGSAFAQQGHFCTLLQGQGAVIVAQQNHALLLDFAAELGRSLLHGSSGRVVTGKILRVVAAFFGGSRLGNSHTDHRRIVVGQRNGNQTGRPQQRKYKRQQNSQYPPYNTKKYFHAFLLFFGFYFTQNFIVPIILYGRFFV